MGNTYIKLYFNYSAFQYFLNEYILNTQQLSLFVQLYVCAN